MTGPSLEPNGTVRGRAAGQVVGHAAARLPGPPCNYQYYGSFFFPKNKCIYIYTYIYICIYVCIHIYIYIWVSYVDAHVYPHIDRYVVSYTSDIASLPLKLKLFLHVLEPRPTMQFKSYLSCIPWGRLEPSLQETPSRLNRPTLAPR